MRPLVPVNVLRAFTRHAPRFIAISWMFVRVQAQVPDTLFYSLFDPGTGPQFNTGQGSSVAVGVNFAATGAPSDAVGGYNSGVVKVYNPGSGALLFTLTNPTPAEDD